MMINYFTLIGNGLRHIDRSLFTTVNILSLDISFNNLTSLQDIVAVLHEGTLRKFTAVNNKFTVVPAGAFQGLTTLVSVNLMGNAITAIESKAFQTLGERIELNLLGNPLRKVPSDAFRDLKYTKIYLNCAQISPFPSLPEGVTAMCLPDSYSTPIDVFCSVATLLLTTGFSCQAKTQLLGLPQKTCRCNRCPNGTKPSGKLTEEWENLDMGCLPCPAGGWYQDKAGKRECKRCGYGTFVPLHRPELRANNGANCSSCPAGTDTTKYADFRACHCLPGYYRRDRFGPCKACNISSPGLECVHDHALVRRGYWWRWPSSDDSATRYVAFTENVQTYNDLYPKDTVVFNGSLPLVYQCPTPDSCKGGITNDEMCEKGYTGPLCAVCRSNYFSWFSSCQKCPPLWRTLLQLTGTLLLLFIIMFLLYWSDRQRSLKNRAANVIDQIASKAKIIIGFVQVMSGVIAALSYIPWPAAMLSVGSKLKMIGLNIIEVANPSCLSDGLRVSGLMEPILSVAAQAFVLLLIFSYYQIRYRILPKCSRVFDTDKKRLSLSRRSCFRNSWWLLFLCYPSTTAQVMATMPYRSWTCVELCQYEGQTDCEWRLKADMSVVCAYSGSYSIEILWITCWSIGLYVIALPCLVLWGLLVRHRRQSNTRCLQEQEHHAWELLLSQSPIIRPSVKSELLESLAFLDENYQVRFWYWELTEILRKFLLTCGVEYYGSSSLSGVAIASLIANLFLLLHAQFKPIKRKSEHWLQLISLLVVSANLMMATLIALQQATSTSDGESANDRTTFTVIVTIVNCCFLLYLIGRMVVSTFRACKAARTTRKGMKCVQFVVTCVTNDEVVDEDNSEIDE